MTRSLEMLAVLLVAMAVLTVGCSGGFGPTLPSPETPTDDTPSDDTCPPGTDVTGRVTMPGSATGSAGANIGVPAANAFVAATDGTTVVNTRTDANGRYCLDGLEPGDLIVAFGLEGFVTRYRLVDGFTGSQVEVNMLMDQATASNPTDCPLITSMFADPPVLGSNSIEGSATNTDSDNFAYFHDGDAQLAAFTDMIIRATEPSQVEARPFAIPITIEEGVNAWRIFVANANCAVLGDALSVTIDGDTEPDTLCVSITVGGGGGGACDLPVVAASDGTTLWTNQQVLNGMHCFTDVGTGQLGIAAGGPGYFSGYTVTDYPGGAMTVPLTVGRAFGGDPTECVAVSIALEDVNRGAGTATVTGSATNADGGQFILFHNGTPTVEGYAGGITPQRQLPSQLLPRTISVPVTLVPGANRFRVMAANAVCATLSNEVTISGN